MSKRGPLKGTLRMGVIPTVAPYLLPAMIQRLGAQLPELELSPRESVTTTLITDLLESRLDFVIAALPLSEPALREFALFDEEFVLVRSEKDAQSSLVMEGSSLSTLVQMVQAGMGMTLIPEIAVSLETRNSTASISRFTQNTPKRTIGMLWRKTNPLSKQLMEIGAIIRQAGHDKIAAARPDR